MATTTLAVEQATERVGFKHVVMATDFSSASQRALAYALAVSQRYGADLALVHAIAPEPWEPVPMDPLPYDVDHRWVDAKRAMAQLADETPIRHSRHETVLKEGPVWDVLSSAIQHERFDLLVLGTHGRGGLKKLALGSVAEEVVRLASCPVMTVGPNVIPPTADAGDFKSILFATDFGPASEKAFQYALALAEDCRAKLILLHMVEPVTAVNVGPAADELGTYAGEEWAEWQQGMRAQSIKKLWNLIPSNARLAVTPEYMVGSGFLPDGILDAAAKHNANLIVMGANRVRSPRLSSHILWAVTHEVLCGAKCPVLTVRR